jgi:serine/threonine protein kinase
MLEKDPSKRINATDALNHDFFTKDSTGQSTASSPITNSTDVRGRPPSILVERQNYGQ